MGKAMTVVIGVGPIIGKACRQKGISDGVVLETWSLRPFRNAPVDTALKYQSLIGSATTPATKLLIYPQTNRCTEVRARLKFVVPSSGSMYQTRPLVPLCDPPSSPMIVSFGNALRR